MCFIVYLEEGVKIKAEQIKYQLIEETSKLRREEKSSKVNL